MIIYSGTRNNPFTRIDDGTGAMAAQYLVGRCIDANVAEFKATFTGFSVRGVDCGNWLLTMERLD